MRPTSLRNKSLKTLGNDHVSDINSSEHFGFYARSGKITCLSPPFTTSLVDPTEIFQALRTRLGSIANRRPLTLMDTRKLGSNTFTDPLLAFSKVSIVSPASAPVRCETRLLPSVMMVVILDRNSKLGSSVILRN